MSVKIELDPNPRGHFYVAGDTISGKVILEFSSPKVLKTASIFCYAEERVDMNGGTYYFFPNHTHFSLSEKLLESPQEIPAGTTCFSFSFTLPLDTHLGKLGPLFVPSSPGTFINENCIKFSAQTDSPTPNDLESIIPFTINPFWTAHVPPEDKNMMPFEKDFLLMSCNCFEQNRNAKIILEGCPRFACWSGKITLPLKIKIQCPPGNRPLCVHLKFQGVTKFKFISTIIKETIYFSKSYTWNPQSNPITDGYWMMDFEVEFEVPEYELITAIGYSWIRDYFWDLKVSFAKSGSVRAKFNSKMGISLSNTTLTTEQQMISSLIYFQFERGENFGSKFSVAHNDANNHRDQEAQESSPKDTQASDQANDSRKNTVILTYQVPFKIPLQQRMGKNKARETDLGKTLIRARFPNTHRFTKCAETTLQTVESSSSGTASGPNPNSITEMKNLDEFLATATLADTEFKAERIASKTLIENIAIGKVMDRASQSALLALYADKRDKLRIPRRPQWKVGQSAQEIDKAEREAFLEWRRDLAIFEEESDLSSSSSNSPQRIGFTPFEKNIQIWRQLWRVVERSDLIVQIVDARNPLLFHCPDLDAYVKEVGKGKKKVLLLANKADLLTPQQRHTWKLYFDQQGISVMFYSALPPSPTESATNDDLPSIEQVLERMIEECPERENHAQLPPNCPKKCIGMVGYPNVGKSSTINALLGEKKVAVGITPGKTKHYQTLWVNDHVMLCDCPGLVFPNFTSSKAELVANGILPIDQARDYVTPAGLVAQRIPRYFLESHYGICIAKPQEGEAQDRPPTGSELLSAYALMRGFRTGVYGAPDESRAARLILKDWVSGKLRWCEPPPQCDQDYAAFNEHQYEAVKVQSNSNKTPQNTRNPKEFTSSFDEEFFTAASKGPQFRKWTPLLKGGKLLLGGVGGENGQAVITNVKELPKKRHFKRSNK